MKSIFVILVVIHGLIHLLGFFKAFGLAEINELKLAISKPIGLIWLVSALLFIVIAVLFLFNTEWVWIPATIAIIISQALIFISWHDAKFGTIANSIILIITIFMFATWNFNNQIDNEFNNLLSSQTKVSGKNIITEQMLDPLPVPVQKWLDHIGMVGKQKIHTAYFKQKGLMKLKPDQKNWTQAQAEQYVTVDEPGFLWKVNMDMFPAIRVVGKDSFMGGEAAMVIKLGSLVPIVNVANNDKVNQSTLQRYLLELPWYPSAALSPYITWEEIDQNSSKATMTYQGVTGSAIFYFNDIGDLLKVSAMRYKEHDDDSDLLECIGEVKKSRTIDGIKIPTEMNVSWVLEGGLFTWYKLEIYDVQYSHLGL